LIILKIFGITFGIGGVITPPGYVPSNGDSDCR